MDQLRQMSIFARVAETGSFSAAARTLGVSNSVVSKYISGLEEKLGVTLIQRNTRHLVLTDIGRGYLERCLTILSDVEEADRAASNEHAEPRGILRVNAALSFGLRHLGPVISQYALACPEVTVDITLDDRQVDILEEAYDLAIRVGELEDSSLIARRFGSVRRVCAARHTAAPARYGKSQLSHLRAWRLVRTLACDREGRRVSDGMHGQYLFQ